MVAYIGVVHKDNDTDYGVSFPDFPGCVTTGETLEAAYQAANEVLPFHIEGMVEDGEAIPDPVSYVDAHAKGFLQDAVVTFMVNVRLPGKAVRINITMDEHLIEDIDSIANNRSAFLADAAREKLEKMHSKH